MARRRKRQSDILTRPIVITLFGVYVYFAIVASNDPAMLPLKISLIIITIIVGVFYAYRYLNKERAAKNLAILQSHNVDAMSGKEFEIFLKHLLIARGYAVKNVYHGNDGGVDIVAKKDKDTYSIQAKRYKNKKVDRRAITDAVAGMRYRNCTHAMAITNSYFTKAAIEYAHKTGCILIDRNALAKWILKLEQ